MNNEVVQKILKECREEGILTDFLEEHGTEAVNMLFLEMTEEEARELSKQDGYEEGRKDGVEQGLKNGIEQGRKDGVRLTAQKMKAKGIEITVIADCTGLSEEEIETL